jgi:hypothetical protein
MASLYVAVSHREIVFAVVPTACAKSSCLGFVVTWRQEADFVTTHCFRGGQALGSSMHIRDCDSGAGNFSIAGIGDHAIHASRGLSGRTGRPGSSGSDSKVHIMTQVSRLDGSAGIGGWQEVVAKLEVPRLRVGSPESTPPMIESPPFAHTSPGWDPSGGVIRLMSPRI